MSTAETLRDLRLTQHESTCDRVSSSKATRSRTLPQPSQLDVEVMVMTIVSEYVLIESKSARDSQLARLSHDSAQSILHRIKCLYFVLWKGVGIATTSQMAEFYQVSTDSVQKVIQRHRDELESDGVKIVKGKDLKALSSLGMDGLSIPNATTIITVWTPRAALRLGMLLRDSTIAKTLRTSLLDAVEYVIPASAQEIERMRLELELIRAKQYYQDTGHAIALSTSPATLQWLRGEAPPPPKLEYRDRFVDPASGQEIGSSIGRSLTQLITDVGLNPKSKRDRQLIKKILKSNGFDYDKGQRWVSASYLREYPVLEEELYQQALKAVLAEVVEGESQTNLFVHSSKQATLTPGTVCGKLKGIEP